MKAKNSLCSWHRDELAKQFLFRIPLRRPALLAQGDSLAVIKRGVFLNFSEISKIGVDNCLRNI